MSAELVQATLRGWGMCGALVGPGRVCILHGGDHDNHVVNLDILRSELDACREEIERLRAENAELRERPCPWVRGRPGSTQWCALGSHDA